MGRATALCYAQGLLCNCSETRQDQFRALLRTGLKAPNFRDVIVDRAIFTPLAFEGMFGITGGCYCHGVHPIEEVFDLRPFPGWSPGCKTPIKNLYLCDCGCHPGGGVNGIPGYDCANKVLRILKK